MSRQPNRAAPLDGLLAGLRLGLFQSSAAPADIALLSGIDDWNAVAELARHHQVPGLLLQGLQTQQRLLAASGIEATLQTLRNRHVGDCVRQFDALRHALDCFAERGTPCLVLKGLPLATRLYGNPFARRSVDVDLLISADAFDACREMLLERGFQARMDFRETPVRRRWYHKTDKTQTFFAGSTVVELHWRLLANPCYIDTTFDRLYERRSCTSIGSACLPTLGEVDEFLYLMCHGAGHGWLRLKWLCDVALLLATMQEDPFQRAVERCRAARIEAVLGSTISACRESFGIQPPTTGSWGGRRAAAVAGSLRRTWRTGRLSPLRWKVPLRLALKPDARFAWHEFLHTLTKPEDWRRLDLPDALFFLYFPLRPALLIGDWLAKTLPPWLARWPFPWSRVAGWPRGLEAAALLGLAHLLIKHVPMRYWRAWLTTADSAVCGTDQDASAHDCRRSRTQSRGRKIVGKVVRTVRSVARRVPFKAVCLPQAMAGQWMLRRRGVASRLWFGVRRSAGGCSTNTVEHGLEYHAWLTVDGECVLGGGEVETYAALPPMDAVHRAK